MNNILLYNWLDTTERLKEIDRKNHILLDRITFQMVNPSEVSSLGHHVETRDFMIGASYQKRRREVERLQKDNLVSAAKSLASCSKN
jgi:hypothetical protein